MDRKLDELLFALMQNMTIAVSGEKLARDLNVSHSTLTRWIEKLRESGVEILGELFTGYRLTRLPDVMLPQLIRPRLHTRQLGNPSFTFSASIRPMRLPRGMLLHGRRLAHGSVVIAESQTAGRGRMGRVWFSEPGSGLYFSIVLRPRIPPGYAPLFTLGTAVALHDAIENKTGLQVDIKWPNDLLVNGKKVCGILAEMQSEFDRSILSSLGWA
jgi:BirA family biotin operon repressor/biotin-[acetyl-CoA-carboxylase] ligase